jgi:hypothetical protein
MTKTRFGRTAPNRPVWRIAPDRHTATIQIGPRSGFRHNFLEKFSTGPENGLERRVSRFSTICAKNQVLKVKIDKVTVIRVTQITPFSEPPCNIRPHAPLRPMGRFPHPKTHVGRPPPMDGPPRMGVYALGGGWPKWVSYRKSHGKWAKQPKLLNARAPHSNLAPRPTPPHGAVRPPPDACWASSPMGGDSPMGVYGLEDGWPKWVSCRKFSTRHSYHGQYQGFPYHTNSHQFTTVKRYMYCTDQRTKS